MINGCWRKKGMKDGRGGRKEGWVKEEEGREGGRKAWRATGRQEGRKKGEREKQGGEILSCQLFYLPVDFAKLR